MSARTQSVVNANKQTVIKWDPTADLECLLLSYLKNQSVYRAQYQNMLIYADWAKKQGLTATDTRINWVAQTHAGENHVIQYQVLAPRYYVAIQKDEHVFTDLNNVDLLTSLTMISSNSWQRSAKSLSKSNT